VKASSPRSAPHNLRTILDREVIYCHPEIISSYGEKSHFHRSIDETMRRLLGSEVDGRLSAPRFWGIYL